jgi:hypothetical protein
MLLDSNVDFTLSRIKVDGGEFSPAGNSLPGVNDNAAGDREVIAKC